MNEINVLTGYSPLADFDSVENAIEEARNGDGFAEALGGANRIEQVEWSDTAVIMRLDSNRCIRIAIANDNMATEWAFFDEWSPMNFAGDERILLRFLADDLSCKSTAQWNCGQILSSLVGMDLLRVSSNAPSTFLYVFTKPVLMFSVCWDSDAKRPFLFWDFV